jgi:hypothetical protein
MASVAEADPLPTDKLARHTVRPCPRTGDARPRVVVLVPPRGDLAAGFELAKHSVAGGKPVRIVAIGATLPRAWPSWTPEVPGLWLTELTAYRSTTRWDATAALREALKRLADDLFDGAFSELRGSEVFYPHIGMRAFVRMSVAMPLALGLAEQHARDEVRCTDPDWPGFVLYRALAGRTRPRRSRALWAGRVVSLSAIGWAAAGAQVVRLYWQSRSGLAELARRPHRDAKLWVHLLPDWPRANAALVAATRGQDLGVLLHGHLGPGQREEATLKRRPGPELWPGVRDIDPARVESWDTTSTPERPRRFGFSLLEYTRRCAIAAARLARRGPFLEIGSHQIDMTGHARDLAKLLTIDLARASLADTATDETLRTYDFGGTLVLFCGAHASDVALVARKLQRAGAMTVDFAHGWSGELMPFTSEVPCSYRCVWASSDAGGVQGRFLIGGMPVPHRAPQPRGPSKTRVLVLSNYAHRDDVIEQTGQDPYQDELLELIQLRSEAYAFRWRPHPADRPESISRASEGLPAEVSHGRPLAEDFGWADVVVSSISTAVLQALLVDVPVLVHLTPDVEDEPLVSPFAPSRTFFRALDGAAKLDTVVLQLRAPDVLDPERRARAILFGETQQPLTLVDALAPLLGISRAASS